MILHLATHFTTITTSVNALLSLIHFRKKLLGFLCWEKLTKSHNSALCSSSSYYQGCQNVLEYKYLTWGSQWGLNGHLEPQAFGFCRKIALFRVYASGTMSQEDGIVAVSHCKELCMHVNKMVSNILKLFGVLVGGILRFLWWYQQQTNGIGKNT